MSKLFYLLLSPVLLFAQAPTVSILPTPREVTHFDARFEIDSGTRVVLQDPGNELDVFTADRIREQIRNQFGLALEVVSEQQTADWDNVIYLGKFGQDAKTEELAETIDLPAIMDLGDEGYYLQISDSLVVLCANASHGLFNAAMTLTQLIQSAAGPQLPGMTIYDFPKMPVRGFSIDLSHGSVPNLQTFKDLIRFLSRYKMNTCILYLGVMFDYQTHPKIAQGHGVLSKFEVSELQAFAKPYHVEIIPAIATLNGWEPILSLPEYQSLALYPGASAVDPRKDDSYQLLEELLVEIADAFESPHLLLSVAPLDQDGVAVAPKDTKIHVDDDILGQHIRRVSDMVENLNKQPIVVMNSATPLSSLLYQLPPDVMLMADLSSFFETSFDQSVKEVLVAVSISEGQTPFPDFFEAIVDIGKIGSDHSRPAGIIATSQSLPYGPAFQQLNRYGFAYSAEAAWTAHPLDLQDFNQTYFSQRYGDFARIAELVFVILSDFPADFWQQMWRHPYSAFGTDLHIRALRMKMKFQQVLNLLVRPANADVQSLDYLRYAAKQGVWLANKLELARELHELRNGSRTVDSPADVRALVAKCQDLIEGLNAIIEDFQLLWLRGNRMDDSPRFLDLYSLQVAYWQEVITHLETGQLEGDPLLESDWIVHPSVGVGKTADQARTHVFFRKTFDVPQGFKNASLLAIPETRMRVYINGAFLDEVVRPAAYSGVQVWDIRAVLQPGKNVIAAEAWNDADATPTAINLYGEIEYEFGKTLRITSDAYWKTSTQEIADWQKLGFFDVQWLNARPVERDMTIIKPDFHSGRPAIVTP